MNVLRGFRAHFVFPSGEAILSRGNGLWHYSPDTKTLQKMVSLPYRQKWMHLCTWQPLRRLFRGDVFHVVPTGNNALAVFFDYQIIHLKDNRIQTVIPLSIRRPLRIGYFPQHDLIVWGEYSTDTDPHTSCIYQFEANTQQWIRKFCFPPGSIRHIHNVIYDPFRKHFWILTGDYEPTSGIWKSTDLSHCTPFLTGEQQYRAVELVPLPEGIMWATDSERERNQIFIYNLKHQQQEAVGTLPSSAFYLRRLDALYFASTVVEPSEINTTTHATLWVSQTGHHWFPFLQVARSRLPLRYFGYTEIALPLYENPRLVKYFYFSLLNTQQGTRTLVFRKEDILQHIQHSQAPIRI